MLIDKIKEFINKKEGETTKRKIENLVVLLIILIITIIAINNIWNNDKEKINEKGTSDKNKKLALEDSKVIEEEIDIYKDENNIEEKLEQILSKINGVGKVKVMITYSQTNQIIPLYNEDSSQKNTEEIDKQGGTRKIAETDTKKEIIYKEENGEKYPITQSIISPTVEGAIITAEGAGDSLIKTNIVQAVEAVTGIATHKIQVFEMNLN